MKTLKNEKSKIERILQALGHRVLFLPKLRTTTWNGREQVMVNRMGQAKGLRTVLIERGVTAATDMTKKEMIDILG